MTTDEIDTDAGEEVEEVEGDGEATFDGDEVEGEAEGHPIDEGERADPFADVPALNDAELSHVRETLKAADAEAFASLEREWGGGKNFAENVAIARHVAQSMPDDVVAFLEEVTLDGKPLGDHPAVIKAAAVLGRRALAGDPMAIPKGGQRKGTKMSAQQRKAGEATFEELTEQAHTLLQRGEREKAGKLFAKRDRLATKLFGTGPVVGADLRKV